MSENVTYWVALVSAFPTEDDARRSHAEYAARAGSPQLPIGEYWGTWAMPTEDHPVVHLFTDTPPAYLIRDGWVRVRPNYNPHAGSIKMQMWTEPGGGQVWIAPLGSDEPVAGQRPPPPWLPIRFEQREAH